jgi:hypothetical protein
MKQPRKMIEKFGNPDGKPSLEITFGLPNFLLDTANHNLVVLIIVVGIIPFYAWNYYSDSSKFGEMHKNFELNKARKAQQATEGDDSDDDSEGVEEVYRKKK